MWSTWTEKAKKALEETAEALTAAERKASETVSHALEKSGIPISPTSAQSSSGGGTIPKTADETAFEKEIDNIEKEVMEDSNITTASTISSPTIANLPQLPNFDKAKMINQMWSSVVESTKQAAEATRIAMETTKEVVESSRSNIERQFLKRGFYKRDPHLPLDVDALKDAEVVYITDRIITMSHPATASKVNPSITAERKLAAVGHLLNRRHDGRFLVWNLSEVEYDISVLDNQVMTFSFPGSPCPPLGLLLKLLVSMENWMKADERNVAVVHCLTGKGRTSTVLAAFLSWMGEAGFGDINVALAYIAECKKIKPEDLTIPSQRRYVQYMSNMMDGVRPSQPPLILKRIIMSEAPRFAIGPQRVIQVDNNEDQTTKVQEEKLMGCAPYLQVFKAGKLIYTSAATLHVHQAEEELPFVQVMDGTVPFNIGEVIQGDILIRCRHLTFNKKRVSMFRAAFHTGYVAPNVLRLTKAQLDGACSDSRFPESFFLDLIFEKVGADTIVKHVNESVEEEEEEEEDDPDKHFANLKGKGGPVVKASKFDSMLQGDSRFWDVINEKKQHQVNQCSNDPCWGPTVGRRRGEGTKNANQEDQNVILKERTHMETFSIGNEFDFLPSEEEAKPQRDSLMDALNALDEDDGGHEEADTEEIIFDQETKSSAINQTNDPIFVDDSPNVATTAPDKAPAAKSEPPSASQTSGENSKLDNEAEKTSFDALHDMDALLSEAGEDFGDLDLGDLGEFEDDDDGDLEDLESMLNM